MSLLYGISAVFGIMLILLYMSKYPWEQKLSNSAAVLMAVALLVRILACFVTDGFPNDIEAYKYWSDMLRAEGLKSFYTSDIFTDYPPGYMYILYILGHIRHFFRISDGFAHTMLIKMPPILFDCAICAYVFRLAKRKARKPAAWLMGLFWALNPASILISAMWGQTDSVYIFFLMLSVLGLSDKKYVSSYAWYAGALLIKPQALMFAPLYLYSIYDYLQENKEEKPVKQFIDSLFPAIFILLCGILPFTIGFDLSPVIRQYADTLASYPHATINAANIYAVLGLNWAGAGHKLLGFLPCSYIGMGAIIATTALSFVLLHKNKRDDRYFFTGAFISIMVFMFSVKMHERYILPALLFLLSALAVRHRDEYLFLYGGFSLTIFTNGAMVLYTYVKELNVYDMNLGLAVIGLANIGLTIFLLVKAYANNKYEKQWW